MPTPLSDLLLPELQAELTRTRRVLPVPALYGPSADESPAY